MADTHADVSARSREIVLAYKAAMKTNTLAAVVAQYMGPGYERKRAGSHNLGNNAEGQGFPDNGSYLRGGIPDRSDVLEEIVADAEKVAMVWKLEGTHRGTLFGLPPTGRKIDIYELGIFRVREGKIVDSWFLADEALLLRQLETGLPARKDGRRIMPASADFGEPRAALLEKLDSGSLASLALRLGADARARREHSPGCTELRQEFQNLRDTAAARGGAAGDPAPAFADRVDVIENMLVDGDTVWTRYRITGTHTGALYGIAATGRRVSISAVSILRFAQGRRREYWALADELGLLIQLDALDALPLTSR